VSDPVLRAVKYSKEHSTLGWFDWMYCRVLKNFKGENRLSLETGDMAYLLKLNEYLDIENYITETDQKEQDATRATANANTPRRR
jgi:hypothetical protein